MLRARGREWVYSVSLVTLVMIGLLTSGGVTFGASASTNEFLTDPSASFSATWNRTELSAKVFNRPAGQENRLTLHGRIEILDCNNLYGMYVGDPNILQVLDAAGDPVEWQSVFRGLRSYERVVYRDVCQPLDGAELPDFTGFPYQIEIGECTRTRKAYPFDMSIQLLLDPNAPLPASFSQLKWSVLGMYAERTIEVDVPFAASDQWQEVAPGLRILVRYAGLEYGESQYLYVTEVEYLNGSLGAFSDELADGGKLADYVVLRSLLVTVDSQGKPLPEWAWLPSWSDRATSTSRGTVFCSDRMVGTDPAKSSRIRHIIAVHPVEVEIPFVWTDIPLPILQTAAR